MRTFLIDFPLLKMYDFLIMSAHLDSLVSDMDFLTHTLYYTVDSHYLEIQARDSLKYFEISVHIRFAELRTNLFKRPHFKIECVIWLLKLEIYWKYYGKEENFEQFLPFSAIFCYLVLDFNVKTGTRFLLRDKRLFKMSEVEITI